MENSWIHSFIFHPAWIYMFVAYLHLDVLAFLRLSCLLINLCCFLIIAFICLWQFSRQTNVFDTKKKRKTEKNVMFHRTDSSIFDYSPMTDDVDSQRLLVDHRGTSEHPKGAAVWPVFVSLVIRLILLRPEFLWGTKKYWCFVGKRTNLRSNK